MNSDRGGPSAASAAQSQPGPWGVPADGLEIRNCGRHVLQQELGCGLAVKRWLARQTFRQRTGRIEIGGFADVAIQRAGLLRRQIPSGLPQTRILSRGERGRGNVPEVDEHRPGQPRLGSITTFPGLTLRWSKPWACRVASDEKTSTAIRIACRISSGPRANLAARDSPGINVMIVWSTSPATPYSSSRGNSGVCTPLRALASCANRISMPAGNHPRPTVFHDGQRTVCQRQGERCPG